MEDAGEVLPSPMKIFSTHNNKDGIAMEDAWDQLPSASYQLTYHGGDTNMDEAQDGTLEKVPSKELSSETSDTGANQLCHHGGNITMGGAGGPPIPSHRNPLVNGAWCNETLRNLSGAKKWEWGCRNVVRGGLSRQHNILHRV